MFIEKFTLKIFIYLFDLNILIFKMFLYMTPTLP